MHITFLIEKNRLRFLCHRLKLDIFTAERHKPHLISNLGVLHFPVPGGHVTTCFLGIGTEQSSEVPESQNNG